MGVAVAVRMRARAGLFLSCVSCRCPCCCVVVVAENMRRISRAGTRPCTMGRGFGMRVSSERGHGASAVVCQGLLVSSSQVEPSDIRRSRIESVPRHLRRRAGRQAFRGICAA